MSERRERTAQEVRDSLDEALRKRDPRFLVPAREPRLSGNAYNLGGEPGKIEVFVGGTFYSPLPKRETKKFRP